MPVRHDITVTTSSSGAATAYIPSSNEPGLQGKIYMMNYTRTDMSTGSDFTITSEKFGETVWTESNVAATKTVYPRRTVNTTTGGSTTTREPVVLANDRIKIVIAQGGDTKTGVFSVVTDA